MAAVAHNIVNHFTIKTVGAFHDVFHDSTPYSSYGIADSILLVPLYAASKVTGGPGFWQSLLNPMLIAGSAALLYRIGRTLRWSPLLSVVAALTFGALTMALQYTTELLSEPGVCFCITLIVYAVLAWRDGKAWAPLVVGIAVGAAIQFRADSVVTVGIVLLALPLFVPRKQLFRPSSLLSLGAPIGLSLGFLFWYNALRFGSPFVLAYHNEGYTTPLLHGLHGLLLSPGKSFFLYNPIAILGLIGLVVLARTNPRVAILILLLIVPRLILFAKWDAWEGGLDYGPRFLMPVVGLFVLAAFEVVHSARRTGWRKPAVLAVVVAALVTVPINYLSVRVPYEQWWATLMTPTAREQVVDPTSPLAHIAHSQVFPAMDFTWEGSELHGDLLLLQKGRAQMAPAWWREREGAVGWILLALAVEGAVLAVVLARAKTQRSSVRPPVLTSDQS
jgi:4-amino-4-deoxy-L-arabinose transferase-like glycosyltransferase